MNMLASWWLENELIAWTLIVGLFANVTCALLGCFLVLRRMSLMGDAISHAVLPGIVLAYLIAGRSSPWALLLGALATGLLTAWASQSLQNWGRVPEDSSMGIVFCSLFALGVFLLTNLARQVDLDAGCVLYGRLEEVGLDTIEWRGWELPRVLPTLVTALVMVVVFITVLWKELLISSFDEALATALGFSAARLHYLLMSMVAIVTVATFEAVGSVIVIAMLIVPAATARLLSDRLGPMLLWSAGLAAVATLLGTLAAVVGDTTAAGMMAVAAGGLLAITIVVAPRYGLVARGYQQWALGVRIAGEDLLAILYRAEELAATPRAQRAPMAPGAAVKLTGGGALAWLALVAELFGTRITWAPGALQLTPLGRRHARSVVRSHRLWEAYLHQHFQLPLDHMHAPAERIEHFIGPSLQATLAAELDTPEIDPHGRTIPTSEPGAPGEPQAPAAP